MRGIFVSVYVVRARLRRALTAALKAGDRDAVAALRSALAALDNAEAVGANSLSRPKDGSATESNHVAGAVAGLGAGEVDRRVLTDAEVAATVQAEIDERLVAAQQYASANRDDAALRLRAEAAVLGRYLPG